MHIAHRHIRICSRGLPPPTMHTWMIGYWIISIRILNTIAVLFKYFVCISTSSTSSPRVMLMADWFIDYPLLTWCVIWCVITKKTIISWVQNIFYNGFDEKKNHLLNFMGKIRKIYHLQNSKSWCHWTLCIYVCEHMWLFFQYMCDLLSRYILEYS